jgi:hypothetical protein
MSTGNAAPASTHLQGPAACYPGPLADLAALAVLAAEYGGCGWQVTAGALGTFSAEKVSGTARRFLVSHTVAGLRAKIVRVEAGTGS